MGNIIYSKKDSPNKKPNTEIELQKISFGEQNIDVVLMILLMEEILHQLGGIKPCK